MICACPCDGTICRRKRMHIFTSAGGDISKIMTPPLYMYMFECLPCMQVGLLLPLSVKGFVWGVL